MILYLWTICKGMYYQAHNILNKESEEWAREAGKEINKGTARLWRGINYRDWKIRVQYYNTLGETSLLGIYMELKV